MDVRCEKCQTEYELDEARLKPGGVTVKCTTCGHMFKIRKRTITNVGTPPIARDARSAAGPRPASDKPPSRGMEAGKPRPDPVLDGDEQRLDADDAPTNIDRQWLIRLENGEHKSCRELATLQQWIVSGVVTRESQISRNGKTWKRLGEVADLGQYFTIADEARASRSKPVSRPAPIASPAKDTSTMLGYGLAPQAAGGTILPDDEEETPEAITRSQMGRPGANTPPPVPRIAVRTPPMGSNAAGLTATQPAFAPPQAPARHPRTTPPPPPPKRPAGGPELSPSQAPPAIPQGNRGTATWATDGVKPDASGLPVTGPFVGKLSAIPDEPAFAGRVRITPGDESTFETAKVRMLDDEDELLPSNRGSRAGMWVLVIALLVMGAGAAAVYMFVIRDKAEPVAQPASDAGAVATALDAAAVQPLAADAGIAESAPALEAARAELAADLEPRLRTAAQSLDGKPDAPSQALRAHLLARLAQDLQDRASVTADTAAADALRKEAKQVVLDAATAAQRAMKSAGDDAGANLAMAEVLRLQGKPAREVLRYLDTARGKADKAWARELALGDGLVRMRDGKLDEARASFGALDQGDGKLETSGDVRARLHLALVLAAQNKPAEARPLVEAILAAQPEHATARALAARLETQVAKTDPLPPEESEPAAGVARPETAKPVAAKPDTTKPEAAKPDAAKPGAGKPVPPEPSSDAGGGEPYDRVLKRANALAETSCGKAMELYAKALEQRPNGAEALAGMGYCHIDAKQFSSAFSKFRAALAVSPRFEPALRGIAEAYQQQGRKEQAIEAYRAYLEIYPGSVAAKRQLERLGGDTPAPPAPSGNGSAAPPAPAPTAPEPSGSAGSGSE